MEELTNQSEVVVEGQQVEQQQIEQTPATTQEQYFEVKYNKEPVKVSYEEAPTYIQKGMNYDKVQQQVQTYQERMQDLTSFYGYQSEDELFQALEEAKAEQQRQQYEQAGINPDLLNQAIENHPAVQYSKQLQQKQEEEQRFQSQVSELFAEFPNLKPEDIKPEVFQLQATKGLSLLDAYLRTNYKSLGQQAEQQAIQKLQTNQNTSPGPLSGGDVAHKTSVSKMSQADFKALQDRVLRGEKVQF